MKLTQVLLFSRNALAVIASSLMITFSATEVVKAQSQPSCFMVDTSGEVINLSAICNARPQSKQKSSTVTQNDIANDSAVTVERRENPNRLVERVYLVGNASFPFTLDSSSTIYYSGDRSMYIRRYREAQQFSIRDNVREALLESGANDRGVTVFRKTPFIIYRYQQ